jgi:hypothetical protein
MDPSDKSLDCGNRSEIVRGDITGRYREIKLSFDGEHEVDHIERIQTDVGKSVIDSDRPGKRYRNEQVFDLLKHSLSWEIGVLIQHLALRIVDGRFIISTHSCSKVADLHQLGGVGPRAGLASYGISPLYTSARNHYQQKQEGATEYGEAKPK